MWLGSSVLLLLAFALVLVLLTDRTDGVADHRAAVATHEPTQVSQPLVVVPQSEAAILATARELPKNAAIESLRCVGYAKVRKSLLASASPARIDHVALIQVFGPFPASVQQMFETAQRIGFRVQYSGDRELREQTCRVFERDTGLSCSRDDVADPIVTVALRAEAISARYVSDSWFSFDKETRRYTGAKFSAVLRVSHKGRQMFSYSVEGHTGLQDRVGGDSFKTKAGAPVYLAMERAFFSPVFAAVRNFAACLNDPNLRPARRSAETDNGIQSKGSNVVPSTEDPGKSAIAAVHNPQTEQLLAQLKSSDLLTRCSAAERLGQVGDVQALDAFAAHIRGRDLTTCKDANDRYDSLLAVRAVTMLLSGSASAFRLREKTSGIRNPESSILTLAIQAFY